MALTSGQAAALSAWLKKLSFRCPGCGAAADELRGNGIVRREFVPTREEIGGGDRRLAIDVHCDRCGLVIQFDAKQAGIGD